ncbi:hypothetical protein BX616_005160 [Lobosporangium transversale]|uniref:glucan endo-1,3-beta-D-glucosidase n=1 Tax=Lobosporangium transversale TaxID=64571 RepID=A0A1Y2GG76_9FUNG|nr:glycoside hydrolase superfamily [Lobosporangium transversale]KAF9915869.1 hypothetical protein BX616_005160 [Lobosporangium transversale]ORZ09990.1 glycoside hydrolase superfamily [Lobosporangium transversale]|eukprot:XP_021879080.1 glycoside hydrolase superfamily [Lobosporangium transversale]
MTPHPQHDETYATNMTPQQHRQQERRRHAELSTAGAGVGAGADTLAKARRGSSAKKKRSRKCKVVVLGTIALLLIAAAAVLAWYFAVHKKNQDNKSSKGGSGHAQGNTVTKPDGTVVPNTVQQLKRVFYGMAYVPLNAQLPNCYNTQQTVDEELQLLVQTTKRVRLYGTDCNVLRYTIDAIQRLKLDLKVVVGIWIDKDSATFTRQSAEFFAVMKEYGWSNVIGVSVGNEVIFDNYQPMDVLLAHIQQVKSQVVASGHPEIPVFTSDLESANKPPLTNHEDKAGVNLHPFFSGAPVSEAASWFWKYLEQSVKPAVSQGNANPLDIWITEVGWPTFPGSSNTNASIPSIPNLQTFIDTWLCDANAKQLPYYYFEFFDAPWKVWPGSAVEGFWGLLTIDKKLKVKLPDCLAS